MLRAKENHENVLYQSGGMTTSVFLKDSSWLECGRISWKRARVDARIIAKRQSSNISRR